MIVGPPPSLTDLFAWRGRVAPRVASRVLVVMALSAGLALLRRRHPGLVPEFSAIPFTLLTLALSIFLGFRNSACYDRWWEGRKLWGQLIVEMRALARESVVLLPPAHANRVARAGIAFCHLLRGRLRESNDVESALPYLAPELAEVVERAQNRPGVALRSALRAARDSGVADILLAGFVTRCGNCSGIQAGCERLANTPMPYPYTLLLHRIAALFGVLLPFGLVGSLHEATPLVAGILAFALFGLDTLGDELEAPFSSGRNDLPLDAMVRQIERDVLEALGENVLPAPVLPVEGVLS